MQVSDLYQTLKYYFGYTSFRPLQEEIITHAVAGGDSLVLMPTGGGKSLCFQMAALLRRGTTVVVSPLIALMKDQVQAARACGIAAEAINSSIGDAERSEVISRCRRGAVKLLYISPEWLPANIDWLADALDVALFAIDEAHCISAWGHDFRPEYTQLGILRDHYPQVPIMALTATADKITRNDILQQLGIPQARLFVGSFDRPNLSLRVLRGFSEADRLRYIQDLLLRHSNENGIIYCLTRANADKVADRLRTAGFAAAAYHAGMPIDERTRVQDDFVADRLQVVCATIAFGMGIDKSNVRFVVHYNLPKSIENYYQEIGRGGRDGMSCETVLFYNLQDLITLRKFADESGQRDINLEKLQRMQEYAEARVCRRRILLNYFGEPSANDCNNCDVCTSQPDLYDGTVAVQKALSAIRRTAEQVSTTTVIDILKGSTTAEVVSRGWNTLRTFGVGADTPARVWHDILLQMLQLGYVELLYNEQHRLRITPLGEEVLYGRATAMLAKPESEQMRGRADKRRERNKAKTEAEAKVSSLFERLRALRKRLAEAEGIAPFMVFSDKTLHDISTAMPTTIEAVGNISGIGRVKQQRYGQSVVDETRAYMAEQGIPIHLPEKPMPEVGNHGGEPTTPKVKAPRNYVIRGGVRYDIPLEIWESIPWRNVLSDISSRAYWNYTCELDLPLVDYVPTDLDNRQLIVDTLQNILLSVYDIHLTSDKRCVHLPLRQDIDRDGQVITLPEGDFEQILQRLQAFLEEKQRYPMIDGPRDEAQLRKWYRHVAHGLIPLTDQQQAQFDALNQHYAQLPKSRRKE